MEINDLRSKSEDKNRKKIESCPSYESFKFETETQALKRIQKQPINNNQRQMHMQCILCITTDILCITTENLQDSPVCRRKLAVIIINE